MDEFFLCGKRNPWKSDHLANFPCMSKTNTRLKCALRFLCMSLIQRLIQNPLIPNVHFKNLFILPEKTFGLRLTVNWIKTEISWILYNRVFRASIFYGFSDWSELICSTDLLIEWYIIVFLVLFLQSLIVYLDKINSWLLASTGHG